MARITEIIGSSKVESLNECAVFIQMANVMRCSVELVRKKVEHYGAGHIFTKSRTFEDTPFNREMATDIYGEIVVLRKDGTVTIRDRSCRGRINRMRNIRERKAERDKAKRDREARQIIKQRERLFADGQGVSCPKHQGKGQGIPCVYHPATSLERTEPRSRDIFMQIKI